MAATDAKRARADEARRRSQENLARELRTSRIQTAVVVTVVLAIIAGFVWVVIWLVNSGDSQRAAVDLELYDSGVLATPAVADDLDGILIGTAGVAGQDAPAEAAVRVDVYVDLMCPVCRNFEGINGPDIVAMRQEGLIEYYVHPISILDRASAGSDYSTRAAAAAYTIAQYAPANFDEFMYGMFSNQPAENTVGLTNAQIADVAAGAGVPQDVIDRIKVGEFTLYVAEETDRSSVAGVRGTPTIFFDGQVYGGNWAQQGQLRLDVEALAGIDEAAA